MYTIATGRLDVPVCKGRPKSCTSRPSSAPQAKPVTAGPRPPQRKAQPTARPVTANSARAPQPAPRVSAPVGTKPAAARDEFEPPRGPWSDVLHGGGAMRYHEFTLETDMLPPLRLVLTCEGRNIDPLITPTPPTIYVRHEKRPTRNFYGWRAQGVAGGLRNELVLPPPTKAKAGEGECRLQPGRYHVALGGGEAVTNVAYRLRLIAEGELQTLPRIAVGEGGAHHYTGSWLGGLFCGTGVEERANGETYDGGWWCGMRHGRAKLTRADGRTLEGEWRCGAPWAASGVVGVRLSKASAFGCAAAAGAEVAPPAEFCGQLVDGQRQGAGILTYADGDFLDGEWAGGACAHGSALLTYDDGATYRGEWAAGRRNGTGELVNGGAGAPAGAERAALRGAGEVSILHGEWRADRPWRMEGAGWWDTPNWSYRGDWEGGKRHGSGTAVVRENGGAVATYVGAWRDDEFGGDGVLTLLAKEGETTIRGAFSGSWAAALVEGGAIGESGATYSGRLARGEYAGEGEMRTPEIGGGTEVYSGQWVAGRRHGSGRLVAPSGAEYNGRWERGRRHGLGCERLAGAAGEWEGEWEDDARHGRGVLTLHEEPAPVVLRGRWVRGVLDESKPQQTRRALGDGESYEGGWQRGKPQGKGVLTRESGEWLRGTFEGGALSEAEPATVHVAMDAEGGGSYEGGWLRARPEGAGTRTWADGGALVGRWADGVCVEGKGRLITPHGVFDGLVRDGAAHGVHGRMAYADGSVYEGAWRDGAPHGRGVCVQPDGGRYEGEWEGGARHGRGGMCAEGGTVSRWALWQRGTRAQQSADADGGMLAPERVAATSGGAPSRRPRSPARGVATVRPGSAPARARPSTASYAIARMEAMRKRLEASRPPSASSLRTRGPPARRAAPAEADAPADNAAANDAPIDGWATDDAPANDGPAEDGADGGRPHFSRPLSAYDPGLVLRHRPRLMARRPPVPSTPARSTARAAPVEDDGEIGLGISGGPVPLANHGARRPTSAQPRAARERRRPEPGAERGEWVAAGAEAAVPAVAVPVGHGVPAHMASLFSPSELQMFGDVRSISASAAAAPR